MDAFAYKDNTLHAESTDLQTVAGQYGTPCFVYSRAALEQHWRAFDQALNGYDHLVCYAVKANSNLAVLNLMARLGSGFDIVSVGELERVVAAGGDPAKVVYSGVGKSVTEMERALELGIHCFNVESEPELERLNMVAGGLGWSAPVSLRVNPDVDPLTHPYISTGLKKNKFGIPVDQALAVYRRAAELPNVKVLGVDCHIGSQLTTVTPFVDALDRVLALVDRLDDDGIKISHLDLGGGLGIVYRDEQPPTPEELVKALGERLGGRNLRLILEPGRAIVGNAGIMLTRVEYLKYGEISNFAIVDAAMNDLVRPSLYQAWQTIIPVAEREGNTQTFDVVGPICETGDFLGKARELNIREGDLLAVCSAGAYGFSMSSNYNSRPRAAEVLVDGDRSFLVRQRESNADLFRGETVPGVA
ncbi:MAG: diaminopimelate decarboxylase [Gammaproteobacteria bacterium]|nr:diaminopimelate decarboxylase [Gammaproteobacteria bacterium]